MFQNTKATTLITKTFEHIRFRAKGETIIPARCESKVPMNEVRFCYFEQHGLVKTSEISGNYCTTSALIVTTSCQLVLFPVRVF